MGVITGLLIVNTSAPAGMEVVCWRVTTGLQWVVQFSGSVLFFFFNHIQRGKKNFWLELPRKGHGVLLDG